jgi:hypothetical protein
MTCLLFHVMKRVNAYAQRLNGYYRAIPFRPLLFGPSDPKARAVWSDITPVARRDWIQWIESAKREETRLKRIESTCDMLSKGKRRPCCFDRSGMYAKSLSCPVADDTSNDTRR